MPVPVTDRNGMTLLRTLLAMLALASASGCAAPDPPELAVTWRLVTNLAEGGGHRARFTLRNVGGAELSDGDWEMYWNMAPRSVDAGSVSGPVSIEWINGDFYVMRPTRGFRLRPGESVDIDYRGGWAMIKESDAPTGLYLLLTASDGTSRPAPVRDYAIAPFTAPEQVHRGAGDLEPIPDAAWLYDQYAAVSTVPDARLPPVVPSPLSVTRKDAYLEITGRIAVQHDPGLESEAAHLEEFLEGILDAAASTSPETSGAKGIRLRLIEGARHEGAYTLRVSPEAGVLIEGNRSGVFYGVQSLKALVPVEAIGRSNETIRIPAVQIVDAPAFPYRGLHLDVARNFHSVDTVKRLLDVMAFYKLNKLHLHLTEDEGWRVEIESLPELTEVGAFRGHPTASGTHLQPSYGSGPFTDPALGSGSGFYRRAEYIDLVRYAGARHIELIPEINVPGHARAAIQAMEHRYRRLAAEGRDAEAERYRLIDPDDRSDYRSAQWYTDNVISVCRPSAFDFFTTVVDELVEMHKDAGFPLRTLHTGGDEVPTGAWTESPQCMRYLGDHPEIDNPRNLQKAYFQRIAAYLASLGIRTAGWEEIVMDFAEDGSWTPNDGFVDADVSPYVWNSLWGAEDLGNRLANAGYPVVLCNVTHLYFDLAYNKDPREPGLYWGGFVDTRDAFGFLPYEIFRSLRTDPSGRPYTDEEFKGKEPLTDAGKARILGLQGQLWSETLKSREMLEYYALPKLLGLAERAWFGQPDWGAIRGREERDRAAQAAWNVFANRIARRELPRLDRLNGGYAYRLPPPGAKVDGGLLHVNTAYPGLTVRYTLDGSTPGPDASLFTDPIEAAPVLFTASTFDTRGRSSLPTVLDLRKE